MIKILSTIALLIIAITTARSQMKNFIDQPYIEVVGYADTLITPNQIFIKIIISEKDSKDKISLEELESKMIVAFKSMGIKTEQDITTSDMLSNYKYYLLKQKNILKSKEYILKVVNAQTASKVFIQLEDLGISNTSIYKVNHTDLENITNICRTKAIENAKAKATSMTAPLKQTIGNAIHIADYENSTSDQLAEQFTGVSYRDSDSYGRYKLEEPKIEFEKLKVQAAINVKFILK